MSQHTADRKYVLVLAMMQDIITEEEQKPEFVLFHFTFFTTRTNFKPKQTQTNSFYFGFVRSSHNT